MSALRTKRPSAGRTAAAGRFVGLLMLTTLLPLAAEAAWEPTLSATLAPRQAESAVPLTGNRPLHISVSLKMQNRADLDALIKNLYTPGNPQFGRYLTPAQFVERYAPSADQAQKVVDYLNGVGMQHVVLASNRMLVTAQATASVAENAFNTRLVQFQKEDRWVHSYTQPVQVPDSLGGIVLAVVGLDNSAPVRTVLQQQRESMVFPPLNARASAALATMLKATKVGTRATAGTPVTITAFPPTAWAVAYDAGTSPDGTNATIAISTYGDDDSSVVDDLRQSERQYGLPYVPVEVRIPPAGIADPDGSGDDEWDLDSQSSTAIAHNVKKLILYTGGDSDLLWQYNTFASMADAQAGNMSYGTCELDATTGLLLPGPATADQAFAQAVAEGLSWHASTGDDGGVCSPVNALGAPLAGVPLLANYPDSSPYVVAVGGTSLTTDAQFNYSSETAWTSGGGGISVVEAAPSWQQGIVPSSTLTAIPGVLEPVTGGTGVGRGVPDISMNAGIYLPESAIASAADTIVGGTHLAVVGTSLASPLAVGSWARLQGAHCNSLGFAAPAYYALDTAGGLMSTATGFHDVTEGTNGDYVATTGWDYTTGFGSLDLTLVNAALPAAPSGCNGMPTAPVANLAAPLTSGTGALDVNFTGAGSSDPGGNALTYYTLDFGDDTLPLQQTTPIFATHSYTSPGIYTASLTVVNSLGAVSTPATQVVTVAGFPLVCTVPGKVLVTSPAGSAGVAVPIPIAGSLVPPFTDPSTGQDLLSASVAEPADQPGKLVFTIMTGSLSPLPPETRWAVFFTLPGDTIAYFVEMNTDGGTPTYTYGQRGTLGGVKISVDGVLTIYSLLGTLDASSTETDDGTITLVLDKASLNLQTGETLQAIYVGIAVAVDGLPTALGLPTGVVVGETVDAAASRFGYTLIGNDLCATGVQAVQTGSGSSGGGGTATVSTTPPPSGGAAGAGMGWGSLLPLLAMGALRRKRAGRVIMTS